MIFSMSTPGDRPTFLSIVGLKTWDEVTLQYPTQSLLAMTAGMTIPMVAWMLFRGMVRQVRL